MLGIRIAPRAVWAFLGECQGCRDGPRFTAPSPSTEPRERSCETLGETAKSQVVCVLGDGTQSTLVGPRGRMLMKRGDGSEQRSRANWGRTAWGPSMGSSTGGVVQNHQWSWQSVGVDLGGREGGRQRDASHRSIASGREEGWCTLVSPPTRNESAPRGSSVDKGRTAAGMRGCGAYSISVPGLVRVIRG